MDNFDSTYSILNEINGSTGLTYDSVFSICMAIYEKLGGTKTEDQFDSVYSLVIDIKEILPSGGGGGEGMEQLEDIYTYLYHQEPPVGATANSLKVLIEEAIDALNSTISSQAATITAQTQEIATKDATIASQEATITSQTAEINNYSTGTANSYTAAANKGATIPAQQTIDNLPNTISSIPTQKPEEALTQTISSNGTTSYSPTAGSVFSGATITVDVPLDDKTITQNGTYNASSDSLAGYDSVTVNVQPSLQTKTVMVNGTVTPDSGYYGLSSVSVSVPERKPEETLTQTITQNGTTTYNPTSGSVFDSANITVAVSPNVGTKSITQNGTYNASSDSLDGFSSVNVNCPEPKPEETLDKTGVNKITSNGTYNYTPTSGYVYDKADITVDVQPNLGTKSITLNGTYNASSDSLDGYSSVSVNVPSSGGFDTTQLYGEIGLVSPAYANYPTSGSSKYVDMAGLNLSKYIGLAKSTMKDYYVAETCIFGYTNVNSADLSKIKYIGLGAFFIGPDSTNNATLNLSNLNIPSVTSITTPFTLNTTSYGYYSRVKSFIFNNVITAQNCKFSDLIHPNTVSTTGYHNLKSVEMTGTTLQNVTDATGLFNSTNLTSLTIDHTDNIKTFNRFFYKSYIANIAQSISSISVSSAATSLYQCFYFTSTAQEGAIDYSLDLSGWDTSNVTDMSRCFSGRNRMNLDITGWSATSINNSSYLLGLFENCYISASVGRQDDRTLVGNHTEAEAEAGTIKVLDDLHVNLQMPDGFASHLNRASLLAIINGLRDLTGVTGCTLVIGTVAISHLTTDDIAKATAKNWTLL